MAENGLKTTDLDLAPLVDDLTGNKDGSSVRITASSLGQQLLGAGPVADAINLLEDQVLSGLSPASSWADLLALVPVADDVGSSVPDTDAGTHLQATATGYDGASVPNAGVYRWVATWSRWLRVSDTALSGKADAAATAAALATKADDAATTAALATKVNTADIAGSQPDNILRWTRFEDGIGPWTALNGSVLSTVTAVDDGPLNKEGLRITAPPGDNFVSTEERSALGYGDLRGRVLRISGVVRRDNSNLSAFLAIIQYNVGDVVVGGTYVEVPMTAVDEYEAFAVEITVGTSFVGTDYNLPRINVSDSGAAGGTVDIHDLRYEDVTELRALEADVNAGLANKADAAATTAALAAKADQANLATANAAIEAVKDGAVAVPRQVLYFGDEANLEDGDEVEATEAGEMIRLGPTSQVARVSADLEDTKDGTGRWTLTFDPNLMVYDEVRTDAQGNIISGSTPLLDPGTRWTLTFDAGLIGKDVVEVDRMGKVLTATATLGLDAQPQDEAVPALSDTMQAYGAIGLADEAAAWRADLDANGAPTEDPANSPELTVITDAATMATYLPMVNRMVPVITQCHRSGRVWRAYYGNNGPLGTDPEEAGHDMFMLLEYTTAFEDGGVAPPATDGETDDVTWLPAAIIHYATDDDALVQDGQFFYTHQGYLVFAMAIKTTGDLQVNRAWVIQNPDTGEAADLDLVVDSTFVFGPQTFFGYGFAFQPHLTGTEHRFFMSGFPADSEPRDVDRIPRYCRLRIHETRVQGVVTDVRAHAQVISEVQAMLDSEEEDFPEPTAVPVGGDELMMVFRADAKAMERRSYDGGLSWSEEADSYVERELESTRSKTVLCRSPSGRLVWAFNNNGTRLRMSIMVSFKGSTGQDSHWLPPVLLEDRDRPFSTYPSVAFLRDQLGRYTGKFLVGYDRGRSKTFIGQGGDEVAVGTPGSTTWNELITCLVDEEDAAAAVADTILRYTTNPGVAVPA